MTSIIEFLTARLDEDEHAARAATPGPWNVDNTDYAESIYAPGGIAVVAGGRWGGEASVFDTTEDAVHIARWDPARVLADIHAKRLVLATYGCRGMALLFVQPYADHADFNPDWAVAADARATGA